MDDRVNYPKSRLRHFRRAKASKWAGTECWDDCVSYGVWEGSCKPERIFGANNWKVRVCAGAPWATFRKLTAET